MPIKIRSLSKGAAKAYQKKKAALKKEVEKIQAMEPDVPPEAEEIPDLPEKGKKPRKTKVDWIMVREEWIQSHMRQTPISFKTLAEKHKLHPVTVREYSARNKWGKVLEARLQEYEQEMARRMAIHAQDTLSKLQDEFVGNEVEIRTRHATVARGIQAKAIKRLSAIPASQLKPMEAIQLLKLGLEEERRAMGMTETFITQTHEVVNSEYKALKAQIKDHRKVQSMGLMLLNALKNTADQVTIEQNPLEVVGLKELEEKDAPLDVTPIDPSLNVV